MNVLVPKGVEAIDVNMTSMEGFLGLKCGHRGKRIENGRPTIDFPIDVASKILGDLELAPLNFRLLQFCHPIETVRSQADERFSEGYSK